jgi:L-lysine exporter family protein LysE/ArgO
LWFTTLGFGARRLQRLFATPSAWRIVDGLIAATMLGIAVALLT